MADDRTSDLAMRRIERREARLRASFEAQGGMSGEVMGGIISFFNEYRQTPRPHLLMTVLDRAVELHLLTLPEHRYGVAGGITAVFHQGSEQQQEDWKRANGKLLDSCGLMAPPLMDDEVVRPAHGEYLWMYWLVSADASTWVRIQRIASRQDAVGRRLREILNQNQRIPEVEQLVSKLREQFFGDIQVRNRTASEQPQARVRALGQMLLQYPSNARRIVLVGWVEGEGKPTFLVVTPDGSYPEGLLGTWHGLPVTVRSATPDELAHYNLLAIVSEDV